MPKFRLGLMARIALALAGVSLIPLALVAVRLVDVNSDALRDQVLETHSMAARSAAESVGSFLDGVGTLADTLASHPAVLADPQSSTSQELLAGVLAARTDLGGVFVVDSEGEVVVGAQRRGMAEELAPVMEPPSSGAVTHVSGVSQRWLRFDRAVGDSGDRVLLMVDAEPLGGMVRSLELGDQAAIVLATEAGEVLTGNTESLDGFPPAMIEQARARKLDGAREFEAAPGEEGTVLGAFAAVGPANWYVASRQPSTVARATLVRVQQQSLWAVGIALGLIALLSSLAYFTLVRPIQGLVGAQRKLAGLSPQPTGGNEIEQLRASFEVIERRIQDQEEIGKVFLGRYQVIEMLGEGAMGTVFRGWDPLLKRQVALKTVRLSQELAGTRRRQLASQLLREATAAARINHSNIVSIYDVEDSPDVAFIAMEFVEGIGLDQHLWHHKSLPADQVCALGTAIADALSASHRHGIVHRDVKPSNVLLAYDGDIKVADFGIAEFLSSMTNESETFFGTPGYVPPETLRGEGYDQLGDLFALGVVLYECLTGVQPFAGKDLRETAIKTLKRSPIAPGILRPEIPAELDQLVLALLAKAREDRPQSAKQVLEWLERPFPNRKIQWSARGLPAKEQRSDPQTVPRSQLMQTLPRSTPLP